MILKGLLVDTELISRNIFNNNTMIEMEGRDDLIMTMIKVFINLVKIKATLEKGNPHPTIRETYLARVEAGDPLLAPVRTKVMLPTIIRKLPTSLEVFNLTLSMDTQAAMIFLRFNMNSLN
jgi:hypothetical protein